MSCVGWGELANPSEFVTVVLGVVPHSSLRSWLGLPLTIAEEENHG